MELDPRSLSQKALERDRSWMVHDNVWLTLIMKNFTYDVHLSNQVQLLLTRARRRRVIVIGLCVVWGPANSLV